MWCFTNSVYRSRTVYFKHDDKTYRVLTTRWWAAPAGMHVNGQHHLDCSVKTDVDDHDNSAADRQRQLRRVQTQEHRHDCTHHTTHASSDDRRQTDRVTTPTRDGLQLASAAPRHTPRRASLQLITLHWTGNLLPRKSVNTHKTPLMIHISFNLNLLPRQSIPGDLRSWSILTPQSWSRVSWFKGRVETGRQSTKQIGLPSPLTWLTVTCHHPQYR